MGAGFLIVSFEPSSVSPVIRKPGHKKDSVDNRQKSMLNQDGHIRYIPSSCNLPWTKFLRRTSATSRAN